MKKQLVVLPILLGSLLTAFSAQAANSTNLKVTGTIVPPACTATFPANNTIDFGDISPTSLSSTEFTKLKDRSTTLNISCNGKARIALKFLDDRSKSVVPGIASGRGGVKYGLGTHADKNIGGFLLYPSTKITLDGKTTKSLRSTDLTTWTIATDRRYVHANEILSFGSSNTPEYFDNLSMELFAEAYINKTSELPIKDKIIMDGSVSIELHYI